MEKEVNKTLVGGFVVGALALVVAGVILFGSGDFFKRKVEYVLYFDGSVKGLNVGAPVVFRGVEIGVVKDIELIADARDLTVEIPVYIEVEPDSFKFKRGRIGANSQESVDRLIERGLRAQLQSQSVLTGQLMVEMDFYKDKPALLRGDGSGPPEIPTIPSTLESIMQAIKDLRLDETTRNLSRVVAGFENLVNSPQISESITSLRQAIDSANSLIGNLDKRVGPLLGSMEQTVQTADQLLNNVDKKFVPLAGDIQQTAAAATKTMEHAEQTLRQLEGTLSQESPVMYQVSITLKELSAAARSIRSWADYMERHPESLLRGKQ